MRFRRGSVVLIKPLDNKPGRVVGSQATSKSRVVLYLVRYEIGGPPRDRQSVSSLYLENELAAG